MLVAYAFTASGDIPWVIITLLSGLFFGGFASFFAVDLWKNDSRVTGAFAWIVTASIFAMGWVLVVPAILILLVLAFLAFIVWCGWQCATCFG
jgi:hypothetical protein